MDIFSFHKPPALVFRDIRETDIEQHGFELVNALLKQAAFDLAGPLGRFHVTDEHVISFYQNVNWKDSPEFKELQRMRKQAVLIHSKKQQGRIYAP